MKSGYNLASTDNITQLIRSNNISNWLDLALYIKALPYGRNKNRKDFTLVWKEQKGTCSSKHAFLKYIANLNAIPNIELILGIYKMNAINTPKIGDALSQHNIGYIPEAHCYLKVNGDYLDFTSPNSDFNKIKNDILLEKTIQAQQVSEFKVEFHRAYLKDWIEDNNIPFGFNKIWQIREQCISNLTNKV